MLFPIIVEYIPTVFGQRDMCKRRFVALACKVPESYRAVKLGTRSQFWWSTNREAHHTVSDQNEKSGQTGRWPEIASFYIANSVYDHTASNGRIHRIEIHDEDVVSPTALLSTGTAKTCSGWDSR